MTAICVLSFVIMQESKVRLVDGKEGELRMISTRAVFGIAYVAMSGGATHFSPVCDVYVSKSVIHLHIHDAAYGSSSLT